MKRFPPVPFFASCRWAAVLLLSMVALAFARPLTLVNDGVGQAVIVLPAQPSPVEEYAARELAGHLRLVSGASLPTVREGELLPAGATPVYIGHTKAAASVGVAPEVLPPLGYTARRVGDALFFLGVDGKGTLPPQRPLRFPEKELHYDVENHIQVRIPTGTLMAVYEFLEKRLDVRWVWPGESGVSAPVRKTVEVDELELTGKPRFLFTNLGFGPVTHGRAGWHDRKAWEKFFHEQDVWLLRQRFGFPTWFKFNHAFTKYWERYGKTHPDYFARLPNGERRPLEGDPKGRYVSLCVSNPRLHRQIVKDRLLSQPTPPPVLNVCENDAPGMCTCDACRAWDAPDPLFAESPYWAGGQIPTKRTRFPLLRTVDGAGGAGPSLSDRYARFYLAIQEEARKHGEPPLVLGYAYANYIMPPKETKLNNGIIICYVGWPYFPWTPEKIVNARKQWQGWADTGVQLMARPNSILSGHNFPIFYARPMAETFRHAAQNGLSATHFSSFLGQWGTQGPTLYTLARMHVNPEQPVEEILSEYYRAFGPAQAPVRAYFQFWEELSNAVTDEQFRQYMKEEGSSGYENWLLVADRVFPQEALARGSALVSEAEAAAKDDPVAAERVALLSKGLEHARLTMAASLAFKHNQREPSAEHAAAFQKALAALRDYRREIEGLPISNLSALEFREQPIWKQPSVMPK